MEEVVIIPTGDEIRQGLVLDTNSPQIMALALGVWPACRIVRAVPPPDGKAEIQEEVRGWGQGRGIIFLTGGSGGGKVCDSSLAVDCTHEAVLDIVQGGEAVELIGSNGHLLAKIVVGRFKDKLVVTLPGPTVEAVSGAKAVLESAAEDIDCKTLAIQVARAIVAQYPVKGENRFRLPLTKEPAGQ
ncbi:molybdopterin-binding protein [Sporomusa termitida]|uniref:Putative molybdopterin binding domain protein n=1 Tax=Sporomusa termitida TaxID=2377 RepID=A0A517DXA8_9FIRM|nr:molybdopterin-binding protein [Sporomusa termitida]QDR81994.1 putative molybdopterin binding domain protein [Sporomusa termitida]